LLIWERELDIYGNYRKGNNEFIPFLYSGQYFDIETKLAYNRFRYYSSDSGTYISKDPYSIIGGLNQYSYVFDINSQIDPFGLIIVYRALNGAQEAAAKAGEVINPKNINATHTIQQHIDDGSLQTQYISTTKKKGTAEFYSKPNPKRGKINASTIIEIDTDKISSSNVFDMSSGIDPQTGKKLDMPALRYATKDAEVLIEGEIPKGAYKICK
jgi:RHS repeat-associated protein